MARFARLLRTSSVVALTAGVAATAAFAAFSGSSRNTENLIQSGTVAISDDDGGSGILVSLSDADSGAGSTGCIEVTYTGSLPAEVRLTGTSSGAAANELRATITRGTGASGFPGCGSFAADATDYIGQGAGVIYDGTLAAIGPAWSSGVLDPPGAAQESWTAGEKHVYRIRVSVPTDGGAQGLAPASAQFAWEARNQ